MRFSFYISWKALTFVTVAVLVFAKFAMDREREEIEIR